MLCSQSIRLSCPPLPPVSIPLPIRQQVLLNSPFSPLIMGMGEHRSSAVNGSDTTATATSAIHHPAQLFAPAKSYSWQRIGLVAATCATFGVITGRTASGEHTSEFPATAFPSHQCPAIACSVYFVLFRFYLILVSCFLSLVHGSHALATYHFQIGDFKAMHSK